MKIVNIGGVPEHFNYPWYLTLENGEYKKHGINLRWQDYYGGTGDMIQDLRSGSIDLAVILTEGIIKDIIEGNQSKIVQVFVKSPLIWGIHTAHNSKFKTIDDLKGCKAAISRFGSGSHLMAYVNAENQGWNTETDLKFQVIKNLDGAIKGLTSGTADYFMWEKFTTKPLVDNEIFDFVESCPTPWPCFVIASRNQFIEQHSEELQTILNIINQTTVDFKYIHGIDAVISNRYDQKLKDVQEWLNLTEWSQNNLTAQQVKEVQIKLKALNLISKELPFNQICISRSN